MSGGIWKDVAMRLRDTATNFRDAVAAYMEVSDAAHRNHLNATARHMEGSIHLINLMAASDAQRKRSLIKEGNKGNEEAEDAEGRGNV